METHLTYLTHHQQRWDRFNAEGSIVDVIFLEKKASKCKSGRVIPINKTLKVLLADYLGTRISNPTAYVVETERSEKFSANAVAVYFKRLYKKLGLVG